MKHLKSFESTLEKNIDFDKVYRYGNSGYIAIGKIKPYEYKNYSPEIKYYIYNMFDNDYDENYRKHRKYLDEVDFNHKSRFIKHLTSKELLYVREANPEETEKYNLAIATNNYNL